MAEECACRTRHAGEKSKNALLAAGCHCSGVFYCGGSHRNYAAVPAGRQTADRDNALCSREHNRSCPSHTGNRSDRCCCAAAFGDCIGISCRSRRALPTACRDRFRSSASASDRLCGAVGCSGGYRASCLGITGDAAAVHRLSGDGFDGDSVSGDSAANNCAANNCAANVRASGDRTSDD